jgi:hypothetical protein
MIDDSDPPSDTRARHPDGDAAPETIAVVQCEGFRCMARLDEKKIWRNFHTGTELPQVNAIVFTIPD